MELVCPAGNLPSLKAAVDQNADAVYMGFRDETNARHFAGLNFNDKRAAEGIRYAHNRGVKVFVAINTYPQPPGINGQTRFFDVFRTFYQSVSGTMLNMTAGEVRHIPFRVARQSAWTFTEIEAVAFIQDNNNKEVLQAAWTLYP